MASLVYKLEEQLGDARSEQTAYKLTVENPTQMTVRLVSVEPRLPLGAQLLDITDTSLAKVNDRKAKILADLNDLLTQYIVVQSAEFRQDLIARQKEIMREIISVTGFMRFYFQMVVSAQNYEVNYRKRMQTLSYKVEDAADAREAFARWMPDPTQNATIRSLFEAKLMQLERTESITDERDRPALTTIDPGGFFAATYVIQFSRGFVDARKYQLAFDIAFSTDSSQPIQQASTSTTLQISPKPWVLTTVAVLASLLGEILRLSLSKEPLTSDTYINLVKSGQVFVAPVLALIFFNIYEYTSLGKGLQMRLNWRSALLIGSLCGIAQDKVLNALRALIGS